MWVQQLNKLRLISMNKLGTLENVADMMTKHVPRGVLDKLAGMMVLRFSWPDFFPLPVRFPVHDLDPLPDAFDVLDFAPAPPGI